jgi:IclR family acetate operon transcriptional repressor
MAAPVVVRGVAIGVVTIAGPTVRLDEVRMKRLSGALIETARELAGLSTASSLFRRKESARGAAQR